MLQLKNINFSTILHNVNLQVADGEFVIIIGSNGSGKSTLFNIISGYMRPDSGSIMLANKDVTWHAQDKRATSVAIVMQDPRLGTMADMTIEENLSFAYMRGQKRGLQLHNTAQLRSLFQDKLAILGMGLENRLDDLVGILSGGQRQALSLVMAIIVDYKILLLDEITAALDPKSAETVMNITAKLVREEKRTAIMITHDMQHAARYGDRTLHYPFAA